MKKKDPNELNENTSDNLPEDKPVENLETTEQQKEDTNTTQEEVADKLAQEKTEESLPQNNSDYNQQETFLNNESEHDRNFSSNKIDTPIFSANELLQKEKVKLLTIISYTCSVLTELLKPFVLIKGGKIEAVGSVFPNFESEYVKQTLISLKESTEWAKLLTKTFEEKLFPTIDELALGGMEDCISNLLNVERHIAFSNLSSILKGMVDQISTLDISDKGREAAIYRTNLFSSLYCVFFLLGFEETNTKEYKEYLNYLNGISSTV